MSIARAVAAAWVAALCTAMPPPAFAQVKAARPAASAPAEYTDGEVLEVDREHATAVLKHGFFRNLGMDPMAMEFEVPDRAMLGQLKPGDRVRFKAIYRDGAYVLIEVRPRR